MDWVALVMTKVRVVKPAAVSSVAADVALMAQLPAVTYVTTAVLAFMVGDAGETVKLCVALGAAR